MTGTLLAFFASEARAEVSQRTLTYAERVGYQRAIEEVYWRHRIWPKENPGWKPSFDEVIPPAQLEKKAKDYLRNSQALEDYWHQPITAEQLQAEMQRMAKCTKQPEALREIFEALGNDPFVIAECLARPVLSESLVTRLYAQGQEPLYSWRTGAQNGTPKAMATASGYYRLPTISDRPNECIDDGWTATSSANAPSGRYLHTAVWTGSEMIIWGGIGSLNTGGTYNPSIDSWTATSTINAPASRWAHTAVWTGSEMIVWGGIGDSGYLNTGGRYNPGTNSWTATATTGAPSARSGHTAVWTGSEMIVWAGQAGSGVFNTGGGYNPIADSWTTTTIVNAPFAREAHTAVWTGTEMIVWGGSSGVTDVNTGGRYNPVTNSWIDTNRTNTPSIRNSHTAVWTGSEMIVWGGYHGGGILNTGGKYTPDTNRWTAISTTNAPSGRYHHTAVWTGSEMIVWGGAGDLNTGGRYNPDADDWTATGTTDAPSGRNLHTAVWTGSEMIVWGGLRRERLLNTGGRYCAASSGPITLSASKRKIGAINTVRLSWTGADSSEIDVYRDGAVVATVPNTGAYTDSTGDTGRARYTYQACEAGTQTCSNDARVTFQQ